MRLYIIRHGETEWNTVRRLQGQTDIALNENGRALARVTARALQEIPFALAFTSPLGRAVETAELVLGGRDSTSIVRYDSYPYEDKAERSGQGQIIPLILEERIREISFGILEGHSILPEFGEIDDPEFHYFFDEPERYQPPEHGEGIDSLYRRTGNFLEELKGRKELTEKTILISTHGAALRALLANITKCSRSEFWGTGVPKNCAVSIVDLENGEWVLKKQDVVYY